MDRRFEQFCRKTPGTLRRSFGSYPLNYEFEPENPLKKGPKMYRVIPLDSEEADNEVCGAQKGIPPLQFDGFGNPIGRWWNNEPKGVERQSIGNSEDII